MKNVTRLLPFLLLAVLHLQGAVASAQRAGSSSMGDEQLLQLMQQGQRLGLSETEMINQLMQRGMSGNDAANLRRRMSTLQGSRTQNGSISRADTARFSRDTVWIREVPAPRKQTPYYGFDFFNRANISFAPQHNVSTPNNYVLGPGDQLLIDVTGLNERSVTRTVDREGRVELPHAGFVFVNGMTVAQARQRIRSKMATVYPAIHSGATQLSITLGNVRPVNITIIGEAANPGTYSVSGLSGLFNVLYLSGGPARNGSLRKIELVRGGTVVAVIDFYTFLQKGYLEQNTRLEDGDVIRFPVYTKRVTMAGAVKRPAIFELLERETLADLIAYAGGTADSAQQSVAKVVQLSGDSKQFRDVPFADFAYFIPRNADSIYFDLVNPVFTNKVTLQGAVTRPGNYELTEGLTLRELLERANGLREDAFEERALIRRRNGTDAERSIISFSPAAVRSGSFNIALQKDDSVLVASRDNLTVGQQISIAGSVRQPMYIPFRPGMTVEDAVLLAGGFLPDAALHRVEISRQVQNRADTLSRQLVKVLTVQVDSNLQVGANNHTLQPLDHIFIPRLLNYQSLAGVQVRGEILYPGDYVLERRDETVQSLINRAGGITPLASLANVQVYRNGLRVGTNLFEGNGSFELQPTDSIFIPRNNSFVEVQGQVFNPQIVGFQGGRFLSYISAAGGVNDNGNLKKAYIQYPNGINRKTRSFLFFRNYPKVRPGARIMVPEAPAGGRRGISFLELSAVTGMLTALISLITVIRQ